MSTEQPVTEIVEILDDAIHEEETVLGDILEEFGPTSFTSCLLATSVLLVSPLSGVPFFSSLCGLVIFLIAIQAMVGREVIWLPTRITKIKITSHKADRAMGYIKRAAAWLDRKTEARLAPLVSQPAIRSIYGVCAMCGACLPALEIVPLSSSLLGIAVSLMAIGILARDGLIAICGVLSIPVAGLIPAFAYSAILSN